MEDSYHNAHVYNHTHIHAYVQSVQGKSLIYNRIYTTVNLATNIQHDLYLTKYLYIMFALYK